MVAASGDGTAPATKEFDLSGLTMTMGVSFSGYAGDQDLRGKTASELQESGLTVNGTTLSGTLNKVTGYTAYSGLEAEQSGNFVAVLVDPSVDNATVQTRTGEALIVPITSGGHTSYVIVQRIPNTSKTFEIMVSANGYANANRTLKATGLTLKSS